MVRSNPAAPVLSLVTAYSIGDGLEAGQRVEFADHLELPAIETMAESSIHGAVLPILAMEPGGNETFAPATDSIELLKGVTTMVRGYNPFAGERPPRFIPVLEARGCRDNDKDEFGHRKDTLPIAEAVADRCPDGGVSTVSSVFQFICEDSHEKNAIVTNIELKNFLASNVHGIIVRNNPGTLSARSQKKFDDMLRDLSDAGVTIMTHPDVMSTLGAKDVS